jgi:hypothetical protein
MSSVLSRRRLLRNLAILGVSGASLHTQAPPAASAKAPQAFTRAERPRALALIGDRYHNADYIRVALDKLFRDVDLPVDYTVNYDQLSASLLRHYSLLVLFRDGMIWPDGYLTPNDYDCSPALENSRAWPAENFKPWITPEEGNAIKDFVASGHPLYAFHNSTNIALYSQAVRDVLGGAYLGHPPLRPFKVHIVNKEHPITRGVGDFVVSDEQHFVTYDKDPKYILLESENVDGLTFENFGAKSIGGWAYEYGEGRVVFTAMGHTLHALWQPEHFRLQKNAVRWLLKRNDEL